MLNISHACDSKANELTVFMMMNNEHLTYLHMYSNVIL